jgi:hypothetical protein
MNHGENLFRLVIVGKIIESVLLLETFHFSAANIDDKGGRESSSVTCQQMTHFSVNISFTCDFQFNF